MRRARPIAEVGRCDEIIILGYVSFDPRAGGRSRPDVNEMIGRTSTFQSTKNPIRPTGINASR